MAAELKILKYTGKGAETEVSSLGFKRIDSVVAGSQDAIVDDRGDAMYYQLYTPEGSGITSASYEVWFKLAVGTAPDNQLSNIRLYTEDEAPSDLNAPDIKVGLAQVFNRPTNAISTIATKSIYSYTKDSPLEITKDGLSGYSIDGDTLSDYSFVVTIGDTGSGNVFYIDADKQSPITFIKGNTYIFNNSAGATYPFRLYTLDQDGEPDIEINMGVTISNANTNSEVVVVDTSVLFDSLGSTDNIAYHSPVNLAAGADIKLIDLSVQSPNGIIELDVEVIDNEYYINNVRKPSLTLEAGIVYVFRNVSGDSNPFRIHKDNSTGGSENSVVINGISVQNGGTANEVVTVNASDLFAFNGRINLTYQSTRNANYGNSINDPDIQAGTEFPPVKIYDGKYNMNNVGDKSDFIVMQVQLTENTTPGDYLPDIKIIWDES